MEIVFASSNAHKLEEMGHLCGTRIRLLGLKDIGFNREIEETETSFLGNAQLKAEAVHRFAHTTCFADDSGLEVSALHGAPGIYSARYAGSPSDSNKNIQKLLSELKDITDRRARFVCVLCLIYEGKEWFFEGEISGTISNLYSGNKGFGYDPVFIPDGYQKTFAELEPEEKNKISHRALAVSKMLDFLNQRMG